MGYVNEAAKSWMVDCRRMPCGEAAHPVAETGRERKLRRLRTGPLRRRRRTESPATAVISGTEPGPRHALTSAQPCDQDRCHERPKA
jgi:hypothetical protein